jgi:hypothetical protein
VGSRSADLVTGLSSPLLCAPARRPAHLLGCSASPRLAACLAACVGAPLDSLPCAPHLPAPPVPVCLLGAPPTKCLPGAPTSSRTGRAGGCGGGGGAAVQQQQQQGSRSSQEAAQAQGAGAGAAAQCSSSVLSSSSSGARRRRAAAPCSERESGALQLAAGPGPCTALALIRINKKPV